MSGGAGGGSPGIRRLLEPAFDPLEPFVGKNHRVLVRRVCAKEVEVAFGDLPGELLVFDQVFEYEPNPRGCDSREPFNTIRFRRVSPAVKVARMSPIIAINGMAGCIGWSIKTASPPRF